MVATAIFASLMLMLLDGWVESARATTYARHTAVALRIAQDRMEKLLAMSGTLPPTTDTPVVVNATMGGSAANVAYTATSSRQYAVAGRTDQYSLNATVTWQDGGVTRHVDLETLVGQGW